MNSTAIRNIPTHLFLGFLGSGKTTAILHLFRQKSADENWLVLVNEFGEQGIDGSIYSQQGILVKELPGGCMCCAVGVPLQVTLTELLRQYRPDRLLIESSGAGHATGVMEVLNADSFKGVLDLKASICLVDPMQLADERYASHELYTAQLAVADVLIANKVDRASNVALQEFRMKANAFTPEKSYVGETSFGELDIGCLAYPVIGNLKVVSSKTGSVDQQASEDFNRKSIKFSQGEIISKTALVLWLEQDAIVRAKGFVQMEDGWYLVNHVTGVTDYQEVIPQKAGLLEVVVMNDECFVPPVTTATPIESSESKPQ